MATTSRNASRTPHPRTKTAKRSPIPEPFHAVVASTVTAGDKTATVPTLILRGEWLKACGFPVGTQAYVTTDHRGELALHRLGLKLPRAVRVSADKPRKRRTTVG